MSGPDRKLFLDGLRGWASLAVVLWHLFVTAYYYDAEIKRLLGHVVLMNGIFAVCLFFVISGFALSTAYVDRPDRRRLAGMAAARYFRLAIPILAACFLVYLGMRSGLIAPERPRQLGQYLLFAPSLDGLLRFALWDVFFDFHYERAYILPLWTMYYELVGSAIVFGLLALIGGVRWRLVAYMLIAAALFCLQSYFCLFVAGMILAELYARYPDPPVRWKKLLLLPLIFACFVPILSENHPDFIMLLGAVLLVASFVELAPLRRWLEHPLSQFMGRISFALYLVHPILMHSVSARLFYAFAARGWDESTAALITACVTLPLAIVAAVLFAPVDRFGHRAARAIGKKLVSAAGAMGYGRRAKGDA